MNQHLYSLGWTLVHFCWQGCAIAVTYWIVNRAAARASSQTRYLIALVALLSMLLSAAGTFGYEERHNGTAKEAVAAAATLSPTGPITRSTSLAIADTVREGEPVPHSTEVSTLLPWVDLSWLIGVGCFSIRTIGGWWVLERMCRVGSTEAPEALRRSFARVAREFGIVRQVEIRVSCCISGPLAMGILRSLVLIPASALTALSPEQLEVVLAHELAHIRRADYMWNLVQTTVETLLFFHPAVWWVSGRVRQERELCCDDVAMASHPDRIAYATALLRLEENRRSQMRLAMALDGHAPESGLRARIARILGKTLPETNRRELGSLPVAGACALLLLSLLPLPQVSAARGPHLVYPGASLTPQQSNPAPAPAPPAAAVSAPADPQPASPALAAPGVVPVVPNAKPSPAVAPAPPAPAVANAPTGFSEAETEADVSEAAEATADEAVRAAVAEDKATAKADYIEGMRAAGYDTDVDTYIAMKVQGITPEYARAMERAGLGKPSAADLIAMKVQGVTPEYVSSLHAAGIKVDDLHDLVAFRIFKVDPEFIRGMQSAGFGSIPTKKLIGLRVQGITPEYAKSVKQQFTDVTLDQLIQLRIFHIDDAFIASAKRHGFDNLTVDKLVRLRLSGLLNEGEEQGAKQ